MGKLTDKTIQAAKPSDKQYKLADGEGLTLVIRPTGAKLWQLRYRLGGKEKTLSIGEYPVVPLRQAREKVFEAKGQLQNNIDPSTAKRTSKASFLNSLNKANSVEDISRSWFDGISPNWVDGHATKISRRLERDLYPQIGKLELRAVTPFELLNVIKKVQARGALETAHRLLQNCGQIWRHAVVHEQADRDITMDLRDALPAPKETHLGALTKPSDIGALLRNIDEYKGSEIVRLALKFAPLVFVRPGNLRSAEWSEFDFIDKEWCIPATKMKTKCEHIVPLSQQALVILDELKKISGNGNFVFPSPRSTTRPLSDVALLAALRRMGYTTEEMTAHGFRSLASTNLENNLGYESRIIELQLAHADINKIRSAYKREETRLLLPQRKILMQRWADWLDQIKQGAQIIPLMQLSA
jgi:integrase